MALRSLARSERESIEADANETAAVARTFLTVQAEALSAFHGLHLGEVRWAREDSLAFVRLVDATRRHLGGFRRVWVTDTAGVVRWQIQPGDDVLAPIPAGFDVDTVTRLSLGARARVARGGGRATVSSAGPLFGGDSGFVVLLPLVVDDEFRGFAGGTMSLSTLRDVYARRGEPARRLDVVILADSAGTDTVAVVGRAASGDASEREVSEGDAASPGAAGGEADVVQRRREYERDRGRVAIAPFELPDGRRWWVEVRYPAWSPTELQLWVVALAALGALVVGGWHERRQTRRIADRSRELEHLSRELIQANRVKSEFLANVSHELRTPLNAIVGFTELLRDGMYGELGPRQAGPVARIEASAQHLRQLVDQVLDLAKMAAGRLEVHEERVDLRQFVLDIATEMEPLVAERGLSFSLAVSASTPRVRTDPAHLRQIVVNLIGNALKFTDSGTVTVRARPVTPLADDGAGASSGASSGASGGNGAGDVSDALRAASPDPAAAWVVIQVSDTGIGIAPRDHERIFQEFEQVSPGSRGDADRAGTGLGLPISRRLAILLGGDLTLESQPGRGSTFTVWLPI